MDFPVLETPRLRLTELQSDDVNTIFALFSDDLVVEHYDLEAFAEPSQAEKLIRFFQARFNEKTGIRWAIRLKDSNALIGTCGFNSWNPRMRNASVGYDLSPTHWGQGLATEAVHRIIREAFAGNLACGELNRIQADTVPGNRASESVLRKLGFKKEGVRRQSGYWKARYHDLTCFGLIKAEFQQGNES